MDLRCESTRHPLLPCLLALFAAAAFRNGIWHKKGGAERVCPPPKGKGMKGEEVASARTMLVYPRAKIFFGQNMKIHVYLGPVLQGMCWFFCCFTTEKKFQSWGVRAERSREGLRSAHLLGSCASGMAGGKILTHLPKTTGHAPSGHKTE